MSEQIQGWKPPVMYDIALDEVRIVTQNDVDEFLAANRAFGKIINLAREIISTQESLQAEVRHIRERTE